jgi:hypothetical protein
MKEEEYLRQDHRESGEGADCSLKLMRKVVAFEESKNKG